MQLAAAGDVQRADINARAFAAKIPGAVDFTIGRAIVTGTAILYPAAPSIVADAQVADLRYGVTTIAEARAQVRSEERRVGKEVSVRVEFGGRRIIKKKNNNIIRTHNNVTNNK